MRKLSAANEKLADAMRAVRKAYGHTQEEHCFLYGVSVSTYLRWERWGPPNTPAHQGYVRDRLRLLKNRLWRNNNAKKQRAKAGKDARAVSAAD